MSTLFLVKREILTFSLMQRGIRAQNKSHCSVNYFDIVKKNTEHTRVAQHIVIYFLDRFISLLNVNRSYLDIFHGESWPMRLND